MRTMRKCQVLAVLFLAWAGPAMAQGGPDLAPVKAWIAKQAGIKSLIVDIRQERHLRTVKKPLESTGRFWFVQGGAFRWQAGDPPKLVAVMTPAEEFSVIYPAKKTAEVFSKAALEREDAGQGIAFLRAGFPSSLDEFLQRFEVTEIKSVDGWDNVEVKPAGAGSSFAVRKMVLTLNQKTNRLGAMQIHLRDGSWINNTVIDLKENPAIPDSQFSYDLTGFEVKRK
ncbi:MAG: LolA family protein [Verrucomicrobiales bacterium]|nr:LolA family protein [Verrucomicrobiales bacterium]